VLGFGAGGIGGIAGPRVAEAGPGETPPPAQGEAPPEAPPVAAAVVPSAERGHALVKRDCGGCHAVEADGDSPLARAPAFRTRHDKYPLEALEEALAEGIFSGHPAMPEYEYAPEEIDDIIAWMRTLDAP
jgi:mono/diheme cytochrome c family protein